MADVDRYKSKVDAYLNKAPGKIGRIWKVVSKVSTVVTTVYTIVTPVRKADGSIDVEATALRYYKAARSATGRINVPEFAEQEKANQAKIIDNGDGTVTIVAPMWIHDP